MRSRLLLSACMVKVIRPGPMDPKQDPLVSLTSSHTALLASPDILLPADEGEGLQFP
jgi:hypothetical protein